jgi:L-glutamine-phosphate cytidylyltransferase
MSFDSSRRVVICAAGRGSRLRPLTDDRPKALVHAGGKPLLAHSLESLAATGRVRDLVMAVGYRAEQIRDFVGEMGLPFPVRYVDCPDHLHTNSIVSLWRTRELLGEGFVLIDSDIWYEPELLAPLFEAREDTLLVDDSRGWAEIDMKVTLREGRVWHMDKALPAEETQGEFFGMSAFTPEGAAALVAELDAMVAAGDTGVWYEFAMRNLAKRHPIVPRFTRFSTWCEVDAEADLALAEEKISRARRVAEAA